MMFKKNKDSKLDDLLSKYQSLQENYFELQKRYNLQLEKHLPYLEELQQNKIYYINVENANYEDIELLHYKIKDLTKRLKWTPPTILLLNQNIKEMSYEQMKELIAELKLELNKRGKDDK